MIASRSAFAQIANLKIEPIVGSGATCAALALRISCSNEKARAIHYRRASKFGGASGIRPHKRRPRFRLQAKPFESRRDMKQFMSLEAHRTNKKPADAGF
jgi:hypothetical protein